MLKICWAVLMTMFAIASFAGCTSHPQDRGDVTGQDESNTYRTTE